MKKIIFNNNSIPVALLLLCLVSYGILAPWLGFIQDDWYHMWQVHTFGPTIFIKYFYWARPYLAGIYIITSSLLGTSSLNWQIFAIFCHWITTIVLWWVLCMTWPHRYRQITWITFLFAIYPGFRESNIAVIYSNLFLVLAIHLFSLGAMLGAIRRPQRFWPLTIVAALSSTFSLFSVEYFFGLELLRPIFIWIGLRNREDNITGKARLKSTGIHWLPYLFITLLFFVWRIFIFKFPTKYKPVLFNDFVVNPLLIIFKQIHLIIQDALDVNLFAWNQTLSLLKDIKAPDLSTLLAFVIALIGGLAVYIYLSKLKTTKDTEEQDPQSLQRWAWEAIGIGLLSALVSGWPFWLVDAQINTEIGGDRFTLAFMMGACIFMVGLLELFIRTRQQKTIILSILVGLAIGQHFQDANSLRLVHKAQGVFFRQLAWRVPGLKPGTILITDKFPFSYTSDTSMTAPLNWIYNQIPPYSMQYAFFELESRLGNVIPELKPDIPILYGYWSTSLSSSTSQALVFNYSPPGCLQVVDSSVDLPSVLPKLVANAAPLSNLEQIIIDTDPPLQIIDDLFGKELELGWCYFYEQSDLARQMGDWDKIIKLGEQAFNKGYYPEKPVELLPFIEGYTHTNQLLQAHQLTLEAWRREPALQPTLCAKWDRFIHTVQLEKEQSAMITKVTDQLGCSH